MDTNKNAVTSYCTLPYGPYAVCIVSDVEAAVSFWWNKMIQFVSMIGNGELLATRIVMMDHVCWGLAIAYDKMYITDCGDNVCT